MDDVMVERKDLQALHVRWRLYLNGFYSQFEQKTDPKPSPKRRSSLQVRYSAHCAVHCIPPTPSEPITGYLVERSSADVQSVGDRWPMTPADASVQPPSLEECSCLSSILSGQATPRSTPYLRTDVPAFAALWQRPLGRLQRHFYCLAHSLAVRNH